MMSLDLNNLLEGWPHEPGQIRVRKVLGNDGKEKLQLRIDLGLIQLEMSGRPDGQRPHGSDSLLEWHQAQAETAEARGEEYSLSSDDCNELQQESIQFYHRYIALFQLGDYTGVIRDTQRNLTLLDFVREHTSREEVNWTFEQFRAYVLMMNTRAKASIELERQDFKAAVAQIERGRDKILEALEQRPDGGQEAPEIQFLEQWLEELRSKQPLSKLEQLEREMSQAIAAEAYERAAELRDAIKAEKAVKAGRSES